VWANRARSGPLRKIWRPAEIQEKSQYEENKMVKDNVGGKTSKKIGRKNPFKGEGWKNLKTRLKKEGGVV